MVQSGSNPSNRALSLPRFSVLNLLIAFSFLWMYACSTESKQAPPKQAAKSEPQVVVPPFHADSAYRFVAEQVAFGPRVPETPEHAACAAYLQAKMEGYGAEVIMQRGSMKAYHGRNMQLVNIIAQFQPENSKRVLLCAHWDSRHVADYDPDPAMRDIPILGANDGASGVGVLLEVARHLAAHPPKVGVDIIFFDLEDHGTPDHLGLPYVEDSWCLGSQYWTRNLHQLGYFPRYGILLDMVGAAGAVFHQEQVSMYYAPGIMNKVWSVAHELGYGNQFPRKPGGQITDDHLYVNRNTGIPCINIIQYEAGSSSSFGSYWHTHADNMEIIDRFTLRAVGETVMETIYREK